MDPASEASLPNRPRFYGGEEIIEITDTASHRRRKELDGLLSMAEVLQDKLEKSSQQFAATLLLSALMLTAGAVVIGFIVAESALTYKATIISGVTMTFALAGLVIFAQFERRFKLRYRRDRNALSEVISILHEVEPVLRTTSDWSRLDEAQFRIRLSRFDVERSNAAPLRVSDLGIDKFTRTMRFLLDEANANYRKFVEAIFGNIDVAVKNLMEASDFNDVLRRAGARAEIVDDSVDFEKVTKDANHITRFGPQASSQAPVSRLITAQWGGGFRNYAIFNDGRVVMNVTAKRDFDARQQQLRIQLGST